MPDTKEVANKNPKSTVTDLEIDGFKFTVDTDLIDDVEAFEWINAIESENKITAVVPLLHFLIGKDGYEKMKAHYIEQDGRFRATKLMEVYQLIIKHFNPKG